MNTNEPTGPEITEKEKSNKNTMLKKFRPLNYLRQLSVVIIGVMITFWFSDKANQRSYNKELREIVDMVEMELYNNLEDIREIIGQIKNDNRIYQMMLDHKDNLEDIPYDTIKQHFFVPNNIEYRHLSEDALSVLRSSPSIQHFPDKHLLMKILSAYVAQKNCMSLFQIYYDTKWKKIDLAEYEEMKYFENNSDATLYDIWRFKIGNIHYRSLFQSGGYSIVHAAETDELPKIIDALENLEKEFGLNRDKVHTRIKTLPDNLRDHFSSPE